jgi:predicted metal-dependent phosphotriesterase family hydrolase
MDSIMTVSGFRSPEQLGFCQCHEHILISKGVSFHQNKDLLMDSIDLSRKEVEKCLKAGGSTFVDAQPMGCNRMEWGLAQIARSTGANIIASTGFHKTIFYPPGHWIETESFHSIKRFFLEELLQGMFYGSETDYPQKQLPIRAGIVKSALDTAGLTPLYRKLFRAAAEAAIEADVPMMVHIEQGSDAYILLDFLFSLGMRPQRIYFCHMDRTILEEQIYCKLLDHGISLEFDTIGRIKYHDDKTEIALFQKLLNMGYEDQLLFSLDSTRARMSSYSPQAIGLDYLHKVFIPQMLSGSITRKQLEKISHHNFVRVFTD